MSDTDTEVTTDLVPSDGAIPLSMYEGTSDVSFDDLLPDVAIVKGYALTDKEQLKGVPFIIRNVTIRYGGMFKDGTVRDYVSCESVTKSNAPIVFNDGSTGIRRQMIQYLQTQGLIDADRDPDLPLVILKSNPDGSGTAMNFEGMRPLLCPRGLRSSEYANEYTDEGVTYYLA